MNAQKRQELYNKLTIRDERIKLTASSASLHDKLRVRVSEDAERVFWFIKFNMPLSPGTVNRRTMTVTDTKGYILKTNVFYDQGSDLIVLSPAEVYLPNERYLLNISERVASAGGQYLKRPAHIMFKLIENQIAEFEPLKPTARVPKPRRRTAAYRAGVRGKLTGRKVFSSEVVAKFGERRLLPLVGAGVFPYPALLGAAANIAGLAMGFAAVSFAGLALTLAGVGWSAYRLTDRARRSRALYNIGALAYNIRLRRVAAGFFAWALDVDYGNEPAEFALARAMYKE